MRDHELWRGSAGRRVMVINSGGTFGLKWSSECGEAIYNIGCGIIYEARAIRCATARPSAYVHSIVIN